MECPFAPECLDYLNSGMAVKPTSATICWALVMVRNAVGFKGLRKPSNKAAAAEAEEGALKEASGPATSDQVAVSRSDDQACESVLATGAKDVRSSCQAVAGGTGAAGGGGGPCSCGLTGGAGGAGAGGAAGAGAGAVVLAVSAVAGPVAAAALARVPTILVTVTRGRNESWIESRIESWIESRIES